MHINNHCSARSSVQDSVVRILLGVESLQVGSALDVYSLQMCLACSDFLFFFFSLLLANTVQRVVDTQVLFCHF